MKLIDTHTHIYGPEFDEDRTEAFERAREVGVEAFIFPAIDHETNQSQFALTREREDCFSLIGLHPTSVNDNPRWREELEEVERLLAACNRPSEGGVVGTPERPVERFYGVGEVGLDFYWSSDFMAEQEEAFRRQVELSVEYDLPLVIHTRSAWERMLTILEEYKGRARGILHAFGESVEVWERIERLGGFKIGIGGVVTYKKSPLLESVPLIPLEAMVLETDSPYLSPVPFRGKRNEPKNLVYICEQIARLKGCSPEEVAEVTSRNARQIFGLNG